MITRFRCNSCQGEYTDRGADGVPYFHRCSDVVLVRARFDDGREDERPLRAFAGLTIVPDQETKGRLARAGTPAADMVVELGRRMAPRANARDETTLRREGEKGERRVIAAEGLGATPLGPAPAPAPPVADAP